MATLIKLKSRAKDDGPWARKMPPPCWKVQWDVKSDNGKRKRRRVHLGACSRREAERIQEQIEALVEEGFTKRTDESALWLRKLAKKDGQRGTGLIARMQAVGLVEGDKKPEVPEPEPEPTLGELIDRINRDGMAGVKPSTRTAYGHAQLDLIAIFGRDQLLSEIKAADADKWRSTFYLPDLNRKRPRKHELAKTTTFRRVVTVKAIFEKAVDWEMIAASRFKKLKTGSQANPGKLKKVTFATIERVIEAAPSIEWRLIIALARYGGLRCPSEILALKWPHILWQKNAFKVHASKTEHHSGGGMRMVPLFPELVPFLRAQQDEAEDDGGFVIRLLDQRNGRPVKRTPPPNLWTSMRRIIKEAKVAICPRLWQNLRASRETELIRAYGWEQACAWIGNTPAVALKHYFQLEHQSLEGDEFVRAGTEPTADPDEGAGSKKRSRSRGRPIKQRK